MKNEQKFYSALENVFIGEAGQKIEGKSGYVNLMKLKSQYFAQIKPFIEKEVNDTFGSDTSAREEAFQKLYTFFESYLNETGTPFFSQTPFHKNLYEKVYSERDDVSLFWKTQRLYYVKSEANYCSLQNMEIEGLIFNFDASQIEHQKNNEKKTLEFWAIQLSDKSVSYKVIYQESSNSKWDRLKEYLQLNKPDDIRKYLVENFGSNENPNIVFKDNGFSREGLKAKQLQNALLITNNNDLTKSVTVELALSNLDDLEAWVKYNNVLNSNLCEATIKKAQQLYKKQNEVDYFIHKDAEGFLKEQFDLFLYQYLFGDRQLGNEWKQERIDNIQKLKTIAHKIINYIARFEDELKHIWEKKKMVKQVNYVFTLDRLFPINNKGARDLTDSKAITLIDKIIHHNGFEKQIKEYKQLNEQWLDDKGEETKKVWDEFMTAANLDINEILKDDSLNNEYCKLPIDTKYFPELKNEILSNFQNLDNSIDGKLIKTDNWQGLNTLKEAYKENIDLIYIDPPFNTGSDFKYKDSYQDSTWLTLISDKIVITNELLKKSGTFYFHIDYRANYLGRFILDRIFGENNLLNEIIYGYRIQGIKRNAYANKHDTIFAYTKTNPELNVHKFTPEKERQIYNKPFIDTQTISPDLRRLTDKDKRLIIECLESGKPLNDKFKETLFNQYYSETFVRDVWDQDKTKPLISGASEYLKFQTQKSEGLLSRIIENSSNKGDLVLDYFSGSGTTISTAHKLRRRWIAMEMGEHFYNKNLPRLKRVLIGDQSGISKNDDVNWKGGGFFKYYELEQYEECLQRAVYNPKWLNKDGSINELNQLSYYTFKHSDKLLDAMVIDEENEQVKVLFQNLYPEMDEAAIAETISNVSGKYIKSISQEKVVFEDDTFIEFANMRYDDPIFRDHYRSLLWWKSKE